MSHGGGRRPKYQRNYTPKAFRLGPRCYDDVTGKFTYENLTVFQDGMRRIATDLDCLDDKDHWRPTER